MPVPLRRDCDSCVDESSYSDQPIPVICRGGVDRGPKGLASAVDEESLAECEPIKASRGTIGVSEYHLKALPIPRIR